MWYVETVAGSGEGYKDGPSKSAQFYGSMELCKSREGEIFVTDTKNYRVRRISPHGDVETFAGEQSPSPPPLPSSPQFYLGDFFYKPSNNNYLGSGEENHKEGKKETASFYNTRRMVLDLLVRNINL